MKSKVKNLEKIRKTKVILSISIGIVGVLVVFIALHYKRAISNIGESEPEITVTESSQNSGKSDMSEPLKITINLTEHYITHIGDPGNFYYIDDNNVLWGSGRNEYGQLGQGIQDYEFYSEGLKIAENVVHVDYSQKGFVIFLTNDHKLYGVGNAGSGALGQYEEFDWTRYTNGEDYVVTTPILLMEDVAYANCGRDDIVCLKNDGTVWTWGTVYAMNYMSNDVYYIAEPEKILEHAILVTGGWFNHAALLQDGTVWTWGYNNAGNCGVADLSLVRKPTMVAKEVTMVWTDLAIDNYPQPEKEQFEMAWIGDIKYDTEYESIIELGDVYPYFLNNTVIQKADGSYWVCGENVGTEEKVLHGAEGDYPIICTYEFYMYE